MVDESFNEMDISASTSHVSHVLVSLVLSDPFPDGLTPHCSQLTQSRVECNST